MDKIKNIISLIISFQLLISSVAFAQEGIAVDKEVKKNELSLQEITLPSEVKDIGKQAGSIFYDNSVKNKVLIPTNFWGEVGKPGLHFIPTDTTLIKGLSMAGGPTSLGKIENVLLTRSQTDGHIKKFEFDLANGGNNKAHEFKLESGDSVFIMKDSFREDRSYYTGLIGIAISIISTIVVLQSVKSK